MARDGCGTQRRRDRFRTVCPWREICTPKPSHPPIARGEDKTGGKGFRIRQSPAILQIGMIRSARPEDIPAILGLIQTHSDHLLERSPEEVEALLPTFWVAEVDDEIVGCCCLEIYSRKIAEVRSLVVKEGARRRGLGRGLVLEAVAEARRREIAEILTVTAELEFFESVNFHTCLNEKYALFWSDGSVNAAHGKAQPSGQPAPPKIP
mgnify:CR=1 FL=1